LEDALPDPDLPPRLPDGLRDVEIGRNWREL